MVEEDVTTYLNRNGTVIYCPADLEKPAIYDLANVYLTIGTWMYDRGMTTDLNLGQGGRVLKEISC